MKKIRHVLGISGGKDSAALAIYMKQNYPHLDIEYYTCDTGKELDETYQLIDNLEIYLGKKIKRLSDTENSPEAPFDHFLKVNGGFIPSASARWCTASLKLKPFENFVGDDPVISYVGIRGDENREGYISRKNTIQSIFPFRQNIWSADVMVKFLANNNIENLLSLCDASVGALASRYKEVLEVRTSPLYSLINKRQQLLDLGVKEFNQLVFSFLKQTEYPLAMESSFPLLDNEDILVRSDIFKILEDSGVGVPAYYKPIEFTVKGRKGTYSRSRSGCYFCFYQQKIEWVWLYEQHPELFAKSMEYEKAGYKWNQNESLAELSRPERIIQIKEEYLDKIERTKKKSPYLVDILDDEDDEGCASCFI